MPSGRLVADEVDFAYVLVPDDDVSLVPRYVAAVVDAALDAGGDVVSFDASLLLVRFARDPDLQACPRDRRLAFARSLDTTDARDARLVHGRRDALVGDLGVSGRRLSHSFVFAGCGECLRVLATLEPGSRKEL